MSWIWSGILLISVICSLYLHNGSTLAGAIMEGAQSGITVSLSIAGAICLWTGVGKLMEGSGFSQMLSKLLRPVLTKLFPSAGQNPQLCQKLSANVTANILGLGNAATPMGMQAAICLKDPANPGIATDELCRLIVLNTASIQLIPGNVAAIRASLGAAAPFDILPAVWITSLCSAGFGLLAAWCMGKVWRHD